MDEVFAVISQFLERFLHSYFHDLHILVIQKLEEKMGNRDISFPDLKN
jgi:hypothetical protein